MTSSSAYVWGSTAAERTRAFPCDKHLLHFDHELFRAVDVDASARAVYRWLCQLRAAPYSYDSLDNFGRQSPRRLIAGLEDLSVGLHVMTIFTLVEFEQNHHVTLMLTSPRAIAIFGTIGITYAVFPLSDCRCRLVVKYVVHYPKNRWGAVMRRLFPWGDLFMMRKQLMTLKHLAEHQDGIR